MVPHAGETQQTQGGAGNAGTHERRNARTQGTQVTQPYEERRGDQRCLVIMESYLYTVFYPYYSFFTSPPAPLLPSPSSRLTSRFSFYNTTLSHGIKEEGMYQEGVRGDKNDIEQSREEEKRLCWSSRTHLLFISPWIYIHFIFLIRVLRTRRCISGS